MDINKAMQICIKNNVKVYPLNGYVYASGFTDEPKKFDNKPVNNKDLNDALTKTYIFYAKKLSIQNK